VEIIKSISEVKDVKQGSVGAGGGIINNLAAILGYGEYDGYEVVTDAQTIHVLIDNGQCCCESWGYLASDDDLSAFVGATLHGIALVDKGMNTRMVEAGQSLDEGGIVFVNFDTDRGLLQLACYNGHNGYYGHEVHIISNQITQAIGV